MLLLTDDHARGDYDTDTRNAMRTPSTGIQQFLVLPKHYLSTVAAVTATALTLCRQFHVFRNGRGLEIAGELRAYKYTAFRNAGLARGNARAIQEKRRGKD